MKQEVFLDQCCLHLVKWSIRVYSGTTVVILAVGKKFNFR